MSASLAESFARLDRSSVQFERLVSAADLAEIISVDPETLRQMARRGKFRLGVSVVRVGRRVLFRPSEVLRDLEAATLREYIQPVKESIE